ncbi:Gas vesicle protein GvpH, heat shock protein Hsp20 [Rhodovulum sp. P5]|uniref:Hsp20/alpha crystallin family protein n=1 Tax=Rhodovulum sp. P5 TaxID=1564506 RepID=UPI0009C2E8A9|nr:Hsp20/alpha crystallin family protein [Rhodovulum sp. P5]ARE42203.1 Gas vesicle protein GvpH, heat shock protein Hsp20 [Rhodovulum sp. P5]
MDEKNKDRFRKAGEEIDVRLGDLLGDLGSALSEMMDRLESGQSQEVRRDYSVDTGKGPIRAETGIRVRVAGQEVGSTRQPRAPRPVNRPAGKPAARAEAAAPASPKPRPIAADIFSDGGQWQLVADLPGIDADGLTLSEEGAELVVAATGRGRRFEGRFTMPEGLGLADLSVSLNNGILEITAELPGEADT